MVHVTDLFPAAQWRHLLRASLRECSYLPDPIARKFMHKHILGRYRGYTRRRRKAHDPLGILRLVRLRRAAKHTLSLLQRANEGYSKPLERVLLTAYGRIGRRRHQLLEALLTSDVPPNTDAVKEMIHRPRKFEDGWQAPAILVDLLRSQLSNGLVGRFGIRPQVKILSPRIPKENSWGRPLALCRRQNIRKAWYSAALNSVLPPLPKVELSILRGLLFETVSWSPVARRKGPLKALPSETSLHAKFIVEGPEKRHTFGKFINGRPHVITRRLMQRLWQRIYCLVPVITTSHTDNKKSFQWGEWRQRRALALSMPDGQILNLFEGVDEKGKLKAQKEDTTGDSRLAC
jgi:hypothetical protein